jgi:hypothetical protein
MRLRKLLVVALLNAVMRTRRLECGDSSPLLYATTGRGVRHTADESAVEKAGASSRTPKKYITKGPK